MTKSKEKELSRWRLEIVTQGNGKIAKSMEKGCINLAIKIFTKASLWKECDTEKAFISGLMEVFMKGSGNQIK